MASVKVLLRTDKQNKQGQHPVVIQVVHHRKKRTVSLGHYLYTNEWDSDDEKAIEKSNIKEYKLYLQRLNSVIAKKISTIKKAIVDLEETGNAFTVDSIMQQFKRQQNSATFFSYGERIVQKLEDTGRLGNATYYETSLNAFKKFRDYRDLTFDELTYKMVLAFEEYLQNNNCKVNSIAAYMKAIRAIYNTAIKEGDARQELYPFNKYHIKLEKTVKRAIVKGSITSMKELDLSQRPDLIWVRDIFLFSFYCRGMSFIDVAFLKVSNIENDRINYARNKTHQKFSIKLTDPIREIISRYNDLSDPESFLFPIIKEEHKSPYQSYNNGRSLVNNKLKEIGKLLGLNVPLTTYVSRHSWATIAKRSGIPTAIISEGLGHETERTTQIYLDSFENQVLDDANDLITNI
ncbi:MAG: site-specific integrase [Bacteroidales bacterium]|nr:site-specific integrase [Bacteroidales bacterium]